MNSYATIIDNIDLLIIESQIDLVLERMDKSGIKKKAKNSKLKNAAILAIPASAIGLKYAPIAMKFLSTLKIAKLGVAAKFTGGLSKVAVLAKSKSGVLLIGPRTKLKTNFEEEVRDLTQIALRSAAITAAVNGFIGLLIASFTTMPLAAVGSMMIISAGLVMFEALIYKIIENVIEKLVINRKLTQTEASILVGTVVGVVGFTIRATVPMFDKVGLLSNVIISALTGMVNWALNTDQFEKWTKENIKKMNEQNKRLVELPA